MSILRFSAIVPVFAACFLSTSTLDAAINVIVVNSTETTLAVFGGDTVGFESSTMFGTYYGGDGVGVRVNENAAYWRASDVLSPVLTYTAFTATSYYSSLNGTPFRNSAPGLNFTAYDMDNNGSVDTLFLIDLGPDLSDLSDDLLLAYAYDLDQPIDLEEARIQLLAAIPEPASGLMACAGALGMILRRRRK